VSFGKRSLDSRNAPEECVHFIAGQFVIRRLTKPMGGQKNAFDREA
jgi:hypothetical protein